MMDDMESLPASVFVIESHPIMRAALCTAIAEEPDLQVAADDIDNSQPLVLPGMEDVYFLPQNLDMILLALGNPGLRELDALKRLRQILPEIPVLALTSNEVAGQEQAALDAGAQVVLTKTASREEIIWALREMYRKSSFRRH
jgi:DNA-binding NarL/FixJ family response regulator